MSFRTLVVAVILSLALRSATAAEAPAPWLDDLPRALNQAKAENKSVLVHFSGSDWCGWCMKLRKEVFVKPDFTAYARSNLVLLNVDFPKKKPQSEALRQANQQLVEQFNVRSFPTLILVDNRGQSLGKVNYGQGGVRVFVAEVDKLLRSPRESDESGPSTRHKEGLVSNTKPTASKVAAEEGDLELKKILGPEKRRQAQINNKTLAVGESATIRLGSKRLRVRCLEIRERSVVITVNGERAKRELRLAEGI